jgi:hypothetical protein
MYKTINQLKKGYQHKFNMIRNKKGELAMNTKEKVEIWKEYFEKLLNTIEPKEFLKIGNREINKVELEELTIEDVKKAIKKKKNNEVTTTDGIHPELIKYIVNKLLNRIYELVRQIWEEESIPEEWKETIIVPIYKKGDRDKCENYSGIALGNAAYKILSNITLEKITPYIEKITRNYQNGFRDGRSVIDNISALKIINEKMWEYNQSVQYLFIDFQKAYDFIHTDTLWKCMVHCTYTILPILLPITQVI